MLSHEALKLLKTQDSGYLRTMIQKTRRAIQKLEQEFTLQQGQSAELLGGSEIQEGRRHIIFVNSREEQKQYLPGTSVPSQLTQNTRSIGSRQKVRKDEDASYSSDIEAGEETDEENQPTSSRKSSNSRRAAQREFETSKKEKHLRIRHKKEQEARRAKLAALKTREKDLTDADNELELQRAKMSNSVGGVTKAGVKWRQRERKK